MTVGDIGVMNNLSLRLESLKEGGNILLKGPPKRIGLRHFH